MIATRRPNSSPLWLGAAINGLLPKLLDIAGKDQEAKWVSSRLDDWFYESHVLSDKIYAASPENANLGFKYNYLLAFAFFF